MTQPAPDAAPEVRMCVDPRLAFYGRVAIKTAPNVTVGEWYMFDHHGNGSYTDAAGTGIDTEAWQPMIKPADIEGETE